MWNHFQRLLLAALIPLFLEAPVSADAGLANFSGDWTGKVVRTSGGSQTWCDGEILIAQDGVSFNVRSIQLDCGGTSYTEKAYDLSLDAEGGLFKLGQKVGMIDGTRVEFSFVPDQRSEPSDWRFAYHNGGELMFIENGMNTQGNFSLGGNLKWQPLPN